jgi:SAM-dependent methyltransferase
MPDERDYMETNRLHWDETVAIHAASEFYGVASFKSGRSTLMRIERDEVGDVRGKTLLHLQCHFGLDTLSWARYGATVTGVDFSPRAIALAQSLATEIGIGARFIEANVYDLPRVLPEQFDVVFTSYGALCWLPDLPEWARVAAGCLKPGGVFYVIDGHPAAYMLDLEASDGEMKLRYSYFGSDEPLMWEDDDDYTGAQVQFEHKRTYEFTHGLGEIVTSLIDAGLQVEFLHEFPLCAWQAMPGMVRGDDGYYRLPGDKVPFLFSLRARKPLDS